MRLTVVCIVAFGILTLLLSGCSLGSAATATPTPTPTFLPFFGVPTITATVPSLSLPTTALAVTPAATATPIVAINVVTPTQNRAATLTSVAVVAQLTLFTYDQVIANFRLHGLAVDANGQLFDNSRANIAPLESRYVLNGTEEVLILTVFASVSEATGYRGIGGTGSYGGIRQHNVVLEYLPRDSARYQPYIAVLLAMR